MKVFLQCAMTLVAVLLPEHLSAQTNTATAPFTLNTPRTFPEFEKLSDWKKHADAVRMQVAMSNGLWPMPEKTPLNAQIFDRVKRSDYSIEKVVLEVHPGVYLAGNLFRPIGKGRGPYPGILNPHGHWNEGRLVDSETGSVFARCIQFARFGMVAFAYDMAGYNDSTQFSPRNKNGTLELERFYDGHVRYAQDPVDQIWGISLMGLQTWNNIRALDFLESLDDVDNERIAVTGASGGGTQSFILGAVDDRLAAQAPAVMVSHTMQGGCWCENSPGLRVRFSNVEIAASVAPRPQMLVSATGDWTKATMEVEGPQIRGVYDLFGPSPQFRFDQFDFPHNYNQASREAVYAFMSEQLLNRASTRSLPEQPYRMENPNSMRAWPDDQLPDKAISNDEYKSYLIEQTRKSVADLWPEQSTDLNELKSKLRPAYQAVFQLSADPQNISVKIIGSKNLADKTRVSDFELAGWSTTHSARVRIYQPRRALRKTVVLSHPLGIGHSADHTGDTFGLAQEFLKNGINVVVYDGFFTGSKTDQSAAKLRDPYQNFFTTYNRTDLQEHVGDLVGVCAFVRSHLPKTKLVLVGQEKAGLWALLAAPAADAAVADASRFDRDSDEDWTSANMIVPNIRRIGGLNAPIMLAAPNPVFIHNTGDMFDTSVIEHSYRNLGVAGRLKVDNQRIGDPELLKWIDAL